MKKKNKFFTLLFSCYPGGGHMYLGFMKQGIQLMVIFSAIIAISSLSYTFRIVGLLIPILVAYSIFDASNKRSSMIEPDDSNLELLRWLNIEDYPKLKDMNYHKILAYILVVFGAYILFENLALNVLRNVIRTWFESMNISFYHIERAIRSSVLGIIFILGGMKLLSQTKKAIPIEKSDDHV